MLVAFPTRAKNLGRALVARIAEGLGLIGTSHQRAKFSLSPGRRYTDALFPYLADAERTADRAVFEHFRLRPVNERTVSPARKALITHRGGHMKKIVRLFVVAALLTFGLSTASLADGGSPVPTCTSGHCK